MSDVQVQMCSYFTLLDVQVQMGSYSTLCQICGSYSALLYSFLNVQHSLGCVVVAWLCGCSAGRSFIHQPNLIVSIVFDILSWYMPDSKTDYKIFHLQAQQDSPVHMDLHPSILRLQSMVQLVQRVGMFRTSEHVNYFVVFIVHHISGLLITFCFVGSVCFRDKHFDNQFFSCLYFDLKRIYSA